MANARKIAVKALLEVEKDKSYSNLTLAASFKENPDLGSQDKALISNIFYGVLDRKITLDYFLSKLIKTPVGKIKPFTLCVLRSALYQIAYLDKIPDSAAVNEAVKLMKNSKESYMSGFVNGVLRNFLRNPVELPKGDTADDLSVKYSCPKWIVENFIKDYSLDDAKELLETSLKAAPLYLRVNTLKTDRDALILKLSEQGNEAKPTEQENAVEICGGMTFNDNELFKNGLFHVQDLSSQKCAALLEPRENERILDLCAAPGGKSFLVAQLMNNKGTLFSCDLYEHRTRLIDEGAKRLGIDIITTKTLDATKPLPFEEPFDAVLCDVPCSGLGILRRKPDIKYNALPNLEQLEKIQGEILRNAAKLVKKGGRILYSTCTIRKAENEEIVKAFLTENKNAVLKYEHTFLPHKETADGFYTALIEIN